MRLILALLFSVFAAPRLQLAAISALLLMGPAQADVSMYRGGPEHLASYEATPLAKEPRLAWKTRLAGSIFATPVAQEGRLYVGSGDNRFYSIDLKTGETVWSVETLGAAHSSPAIDGGVVYFGDFTGRFYALDARTGAPKWRRELLGERRWGTKGLAYVKLQEKYYEDEWDLFLAAPIVVGDYVYYASGNGNVYCLDRETGETRWYFETNDVIHSAPSLANGRLYVGGWDTFFYCLDAQTGELQWKLQTGVDTVNYNQTGIQSAAVVSEGVVYFGGRDSHLYAVDAASGETLWKQHNHGSWVIVSPLVDEKHVYYTTSDSKRMVALSRESGEVVFELPTTGWGFSSPTRAGDMIYFGSMAGDITAVDRRAKSIAWRFLTDGAKKDPCDYIDENGVMDTQKIFRDFDRSRMFEIQSAMFTMGSILSSPLPVEDRLVFGTAEGELYCLQAVRD